MRRKDFSPLARNDNCEHSRLARGETNLGFGTIGTSGTIGTKILGVR
jgi:hypothetical protein